jgi:TolA-binding protein
MAEKNGDKKKIWLYATILFMSAFIVLLFTAYSQIRLNGNISDYKNQLSSKTKESNNFQIDLNTCLKLNSQLNDQLKAANNHLAQLKKAQQKTKADLLDAQDKNKKIINAFNYLMTADSSYSSGEISNCAEILYEKCNPKYLSDSALTKYNYLKEATFGRTAINLYYSGYRMYKNEDYNSALADFQMSVNLSKAEYISDDCYYFIAECAYKTGNIKLVKDSLNTLINSYPGSTYIDEANILLSEVK